MVTDLAEFKATKAAKEKPLISRRRASLAGGTLLATLCECEQVDLISTLRFDLTPDDVTALESFTFHLQQRIEDRKNGYQRTKGTSDKPAS